MPRLAQPRHDGPSDRFGVSLRHAEHLPAALPDSQLRSASASVVRLSPWTSCGYCCAHGRPQASLGEIPSIDKLLTADWAKALLRQNARAFVVAALRRACDSLRDDIRAGRFGSEAIDGAIQKRALTELSRSGELKPIEVVNATGVVLHTNLGRALLAERAVEAAIAERMRTPSRTRIRPRDRRARRPRRRCRRDCSAS